MPLLLWLVASGLVYGNVMWLSRRRDGVAFQSAVVAAARRMDGFGGQMLESTANLILFRDGRLLGVYDEAWQLFIDSAAVPEAANSNQEQQQLLGEIRALARRVDRLSRQSFDYVKNGDTDRAIRVLASEESRQLQKRFGELLANFRASEEERLTVLEREAEAAFDAALWWNAVSAVAASFLTLVWGLGRLVPN
ncbi:CHASE3 domain-containing protein [[Phormidium] sp. ETS-05]|uniref:CHASE3 domain-containing protein n=1 Tax=[Phormidium] sp. ETS-05 TaxID=222819 RepID=UPI0018EF1E42|nr:CHASE3 domain-containing protein [[Phormidium] sp. ETS-05]